jgi:TetR/AcrR family transcriptional regulator, transcriptional repressor of bet genes
MPRPSNTDERRAQIAAGLLEVMAQRGYDGASIADVARAAGLTSGLIHYHFRNKQEILLESLRLLAARHAAAVEAHLVAAAGDPAAEVARFIDVHLGLGATADPQALACWVMLGGEALRQPEVQVLYEAAIAALVARLSGAIRRGMTAGLFGCDDADVAASALVAAIQGYFVLSVTARSVIPPGSAAVATKRMAEGVLQQRAPAARKKAR